MNLSYLLYKAKKRIKEDSISGLLKRSLKVAYHNSLRKIILLILTEYVRHNSLRDSGLKENAKYFSYIDENLPEIPLKENEYQKEFDLKSDEKISLIGPERNFRKPFICEIPDVVISGSNSTCWKNSKLIPETSFWRNEEVSRQLLEDFEENPLHTLKIARGDSFQNSEGVNSIDSAMVMNGIFAEGYFHWVIEYLTRLRGLEKYEAEKRKNNTKLIVPPDSPSLIEDSLRLFAPEKEILKADKELLKVENLLIPSYPEITPKNLEWLREKGLNAKSKDVEDPPSRIFISRQNSNSRKTANFQEIKEVLNKYNIRPVQMEDYSFSEQISISSQAELIVAPHGAGLTNMVWGENLKILEIFNNHAHRLYGQLAEILGHEYKPLIGEPKGKTFDKRNQNIRISPQKLEIEVEKLLEGTE